MHHARLTHWSSLPDAGGNPPLVAVSADALRTNGQDSQARELLKPPDVPPCTLLHPAVKNELQSPCQTRDTIWSLMPAEGRKRQNKVFFSFGAFPESALPLDSSPPFLAGMA
jgi:hypothetical protein